MKTVSPWIFAVLLVSAGGCKKNFSSYLEQGRKTFSEKNYISTIDNLNVGLLQWKPADGNEPKAEAYQLLGQSYEKMRNTDKAAAAYREAIPLSTQTFPSAYALGMLYLAQNQPKDAVDLFQKALTMKKDDPLALLGMANSLYLLRRPKESYETYKKILDVSPGVHEALEAIAILKNRLRQKQTSLPTPSSKPTYRPPVKPKDPSVRIKKSKKK